MWKLVEIQLTFLIHESSNFQSDSAQCCQIAIASETKKCSSSVISRQTLITNSLSHYKIINTIRNNKEIANPQSALIQFSSYKSSR